MSESTDDFTPGDDLVIELFNKLKSNGTNMTKPTSQPPEQNFTRSEEIGELVKAQVKANASISHPHRNTANPFFKSRYADLAAVIDSYRLPYAEQGLVVTQLVAGHRLVTLLAHESGQWLQFWTKISPMKNDPQSFGSALTYMRRYTLQTLIGIAADDDDDGNAASTGDKQKPASAKAKPAAKAPHKSQPMDWRGRIDKCTTLEELKVAAGELANLPAKEKPEAQKYWKAAREEIDSGRMGDDSIG